MAISESELNKLLDKHPDYTAKVTTIFGTGRVHVPTHQTHYTDTVAQASRWLLYGVVGSYSNSMIWQELVGYDQQ